MKTTPAFESMKTFVLILLFSISLSCAIAGQIIGVSDSTLLYDYSNILNKEEQVDIERKLQNHSASLGGNIVVILTKGEKYSDSIAYRASKSISKNKLIIIAADITKSSYGFYVSEELKAKFPKWVIEKIEDNYLKKNFKSGEYFEGIDEASDLVTGIATGSIEKEELMKDQSNSTILFLIGVLVFFLLVFPVIQYFNMKRNHIASKPVDLVSAVLITNSFGTRGKNLFDDFSNSTGRFVENIPSSCGGSGIEGMW